MKSGDQVEKVSLENQEITLSMNLTAQTDHWPELPLSGTLDEEPRDSPTG